MRAAGAPAVAAAIVVLGAAVAPARADAAIPHLLPARAVAETLFAPRCGVPQIVESDAPLRLGGVASANVRTCEVAISPTLMRGAPASAVCHVLAHEFGHLAGHGHSEDPYDVMAPGLSWQATPAACRRLDPPPRVEVVL